jgi:hypothetical protein
MRHFEVVSFGTGIFLSAAVTLAAGQAARAQTTGLTPLVDLGAGLYQGFEGGLYPGGSNTPPAGHLDAALQKASEIVPRNAAGAPDPNGLIVMIAVGMSNTTHEFGVFERQEDADAARNARLVLMDTALGGQTASIIANPSASYWTTMQQRLTAMGLAAAQVQVAWVKEAEANPPNNFPLHAQALRDNLKLIADNLHDKFPNLKLCYVSSRVYGGYAPSGSLNPEPQAYESGFSVKWLIEDQINGAADLNHGQLPGAVRAPLLLWGPYLWADGTNPRSDGLVWISTDFEADHTHPAPSGEQKVANGLASFFANETTAAAWWFAQPGTTLVTVEAVHDAYVSAASPTTNFGADPMLLAQGGASPMRTFVRFDLASVPGPVLLAKLSLRVTTTGGGGGTVSLVSNTQWTEGAITYQNAPATGATLVQMPSSSRDGTIAANVTGPIHEDADAQLSFALATPSAGQVQYHSKEDAQPPRLVLVVGTPATGVSSRPPGSSTLALQASTPNPFNPTTTLVYRLPSRGRVLLAVHDVKGRRVATLVDKVQPAGTNSAHWDGRGEARTRLSGGVYFARLAFGTEVRTRKLTLAP